MSLDARILDPPTTIIEEPEDYKDNRVKVYFLGNYKQRKYFVSLPNDVSIHRGYEPDDAFYFYMTPTDVRGLWWDEAKVQQNENKLFLHSEDDIVKQFPFVSEQFEWRIESEDWQDALYDLSHQSYLRQTTPAWKKEVSTMYKDLEQRFSDLDGAESTEISKHKHTLPLNINRRSLVFPILKTGIRASATLTTVTALAALSHYGFEAERLAKIIFLEGLVFSAIDTPWVITNAIRSYRKGETLCTTGLFEYLGAKETKERDLKKYYLHSE